MAPPASGDGAGDGPTSTTVTFPDGGSATVRLPSEGAVAWGTAPHDAAGAEAAGGRAAEDVQLVWVGDQWRVVEVDGPAPALDLTGAP